MQTAARETDKLLTLKKFFSDGENGEEEKA